MSQYQNTTPHVGPFTTSTPYETLGKAPQSPDPVRRVRPILPSGAVGPLFVPDVTQPVTAMSWQSRTLTPDIIHRKKTHPSQAPYHVANYLPIPEQVFEKG